MVSNKYEIMCCYWKQQRDNDTESAPNMHEHERKEEKEISCSGLSVCLSVYEHRVFVFTYFKTSPRAPSYQSSQVNNKVFYQLERKLNQHITKRIQNISNRR